MKTVWFVELVCYEDYFVDEDGIQNGVGYAKFDTKAEALAYAKNVIADGEDATVFEAKQVCNR